MPLRLASLLLFLPVLACAAPATQTTPIETQTTPTEKASASAATQAAPSELPDAVRTPSAEAPSHAPPSAMHDNVNHPQHGATATDDKPADAPEPPHYFRWVDAKGRTHFSDRPPEEKTHKVKKEALTPAPETGGGDNLKRVYQRASSIMAPPKPTVPSHSAKPGWGANLKPAPAKEETAIKIGGE